MVWVEGNSGDKILQDFEVRLRILFFFNGNGKGLWGGRSDIIIRFVFLIDYFGCRVESGLIGMG